MCVIKQLSPVTFHMPWKEFIQRRLKSSSREHSAVANCLANQSDLMSDDGWYLHLLRSHVTQASQEREHASFLTGFRVKKDDCIEKVKYV